MRINDELVLREIAGESMLIPVGDEALRLHGMIVLSDSGRFLYEKLRTGMTEEGMVKALTDEYEVDEETAAKDVAEFIGSLREKGVLEE